MVCPIFICVQFGFVIFWQKEIGEKARNKMLVKLIIGVNHTKILRAAFGSDLHSFDVLGVLGLEFFGKRKLAQKLLIKCWGNF